MNKNPNVPTASKLNLRRQIGNFIPDFLVPKVARETGVDKQVRTFTPWSHVVSLLYAQLTHSIGLNDVCDALNLHSGPLSSLRGAGPPSRNNLSHANTVRSAEMAEQVFWQVYKHGGEVSPRFLGGKAGKRFARKFKRTIPLVDSTTIPLIASCMDWARPGSCRADARRPPRVTSAWTGSASGPVLTWWIPLAITITSGRANCAPGSKPAKSPY